MSDNDCPLWISQAADQIKRLYDLFLKVDATQVEVNPLGETPEGQGTVAFCSFDNSIVENKCLLACVFVFVCLCVFVFICLCVCVQDGYAYMFFSQAGP